MKLQNLFDLLAIALSLVTFLSGIVAWYSSSVKKSYAAERDFGHLKMSLQQIEKTISDHADEQEEKLRQLEREIVELKGLIHALAFSIRGTTTEGLGRQP